MADAEAKPTFAIMCVARAEATATVVVVDAAGFVAKVTFACAAAEPTFAIMNVARADTNKAVTIVDEAD
eukprot:9396285-Pyramimonas_sp.AAC.1